MSKPVDRQERAAGVEEQSPAPVLVSVPVETVSPPEIRIAMVVRGFRRRFGGVVHLAPRTNSPALCGAGFVTGEPAHGVDSDVCNVCAAWARSAQ